MIHSKRLIKLKVSKMKMEEVSLLLSQFLDIDFCWRDDEEGESMEIKGSSSCQAMMIQEDDTDGGIQVARMSCQKSYIKLQVPVEKWSNKWSWFSHRDKPGLKTDCGIKGLNTRETAQRRIFVLVVSSLLHQIVWRTCKSILERK